MARFRTRRWQALALAGLLVVMGAWLWRWQPRGRIEAERADERVAGVEVAEVVRGAMERRRTLSGALEALSEAVIAPKVGGRITRLAVDLADLVQRGQVVAFLDDAEFLQEVKQVEAELAVARANLTLARNALEISRREHQRVVNLRERGIASDSEYDLAEATRMEREAQAEVAEAQVNRARAVHESARIRFDYTRVTADWSEGAERRMVAERFVEAGETVSANQPLLRVVQLDPILAVISVTERDYGRLQPGQEAEFTTDAFPGEVFRGRIERIAPVFRETSRQARVELTLANPDGRLKPGMFIRTTITLDRVDDAQVVPEAALTRREDVDGVFLVESGGDRVRWVPVETGIRQAGRLEVRTPALTGRVVTLGQHLIDDGSPIRVVTVPGTEGSR